VQPDWGCDVGTEEGDVSTNPGKKAIFSSDHQRGGHDKLLEWEKGQLLSRIVV